MDSKLTLTLEQQVIENAKQYAKKSKQSLSDIIENYLKLLVSSDTQKPTKTSSKILLSKGVFKEPEGFDYQKEISDRLIKKYL
jgi:Family of unknown function (DUF6364)